jgi:subtilisin family serine protease
VAGVLVAGMVAWGLGVPAAATPPSAPRQGASVDPSTVVVEADRVAAEAAAERAGLRYDREVTPGFHALRAEQPGGADAARARGRGVRQAYHPGRIRSARSPSDPLHPAQAHLTQVSAPAAWDVSQGSPAVRIAVVDTGITDHPDLPAIAAADRATFLTHHPSEYDQPPCLSGHSAASESAHATHVAGIATALGGEGQLERGGTGVVWQSTLLDVRALNVCGDGFTDDIASGITWAAGRGAQVVNLSVTGESDPAILASIRYARSRGAVVVAAAGNATCGSPGVSVPQYPAAYPEVLAVASTNVNVGDPTSCFSTRGPWVDLGAPGSQILSTLPGDLSPGEYAFGVPREPDGSGYGYLSGTSMAAPVVSGAAALLFAAVPGISAGEVEARLVRAADPTATPCQDFNGGRLDVADALADAVKAFGYRMVNGAGQVASFGYECDLGDPVRQGLGLAHPVVGLATTASKAGYWLVASDGGVFGYGDAVFLGGAGGIPLNRPVVGMAATPTGRGYWLVASDGGIFAYGDAAFLGSTGGITLNQPIVGMAPTPTGRGYWLVASDGGIFAYGDARFLGSTGGIRLNRPVRSVQPTRTGDGYWMVATDGGIFAYGDAPFLGSTGGVVLNRPVVGMAATPQAGGYWLVASDGGLFSFGAAPFFGSGVGRLTDVVAAGG